MYLYKNDDILSIEYTKPVFRLKWRLTGWCNYSCPYCINGQNKESAGGWNTTELLIERARKINKFLKDNNITKKIHLSLIGGEVTYLDLYKIIPEIDNISHVNITTNFSRKVDYFKELFIWSRTNNIRLFINCSNHSQNKDFKEKFIELYNWCKQNKFSLPRASFVVTDETNIDELIKDYKDNGITKIVLQKVKAVINDEITDKIEEPEEIKLMESNRIYENSTKNQSKDYKITFKDGSVVEYTSISNFLASLDRNGFVPDGYICHSGLNGVLVNWDGNVYRTNCIELENTTLGNIDTDDIKMPTEPHICYNADCRCCLRNGTSVYKIV